jgi:outer membrane protein assembly factor BamB
MRSGLVALLMASGCRFDAPDQAQLPPFGSLGAGLLRFGPPAPAAGPFDLAVDVHSDRVFVSNQHAPFVIVADRTTGAWLDAIDLRQSGEQHFTHQRLALMDGAVHVPNERAHTMLRYDADSLEALDPIVPGAPMISHCSHGEELWVSTPEETQRYDDGTLTARFPIDFFPALMAVDGDMVAYVDPDQQLLLVHGREGDRRWSVDLELEEVSDLLVDEGRIYLTDRLAGAVLAYEEGELLASASVGADPASVSLVEDMIVVVSRLGEALPDSGSYQGAPSLLVALDRDLEPRWSAEAARGVRHIDWDGDLIWAAAEGAQRLLAFEPDDGALAIDGPRLGLSIDQLERHENRVIFPSQGGDSLHWVDLGDGSDGSTETCSWPAVARIHRGDLWLACQDEGSLLRLELEGFEILEELEVAETFQRPCADASCEQPYVGMDMADDMGVLAYSDPKLPGVRWVDGREPVVFATQDDEPDLAQHMGLKVLGGALLAHEPFGRHSWLVDRGAEDLGTDLGESTATFPLVGGGQRVWLGPTEILGSLQEGAELGELSQVVAASERWLLAEHGWQLEVYDAASQELMGELCSAELRSPPFVRSTGGEPGPLRYLLVEPDLLVIGNTFRATIELRRLPGLEPVGDDEPLPLGAWASLEGLY